MKYRIITILAILVSLSLVPPVQALDYQPFDGRQGYQEIAISPGLYFVAFHALYKTSPTDLEAAWLTRAAELCSAEAARFFVEINYSFEPVLKTDGPLFGINDDWIAKAVVPLFIPIIIPGNLGPVQVDPPTRQAHIRCVKDSSLVVEPSRVIDGTKIIEDANLRGWMPRRSN